MLVIVHTAFEDQLSILCLITKIERHPMNYKLSKNLKCISIIGLTCLTVIPFENSVFAADKIEIKPNTQMQAVLDELTKLEGKSLGTVSAAEARKQPTPGDAVKALLKRQGKSTKPEEVGSVIDKSISGPGGPIDIRIYTPKGKGPFPVIVYFHGGGWVIANLDVYDASPRAMANKANAIVVSSHYRQGPEHKFPAAHDDALAAYKWTLEHARELNGNPALVAVMGESAGGNLAAAVSILAREQHLQMPVYQVLVYPIAGYDFNTTSYVENASAKPLSRPAMKWFFENYLKSNDDGKNHLISLVNEKDLKGLPPTTIISAQIDPLRSEGKDYSDKLQKAGIKVSYKNYEAVTHEFFGMAAVLDEAKDAQKFVAEGLNKVFLEKK